MDGQTDADEIVTSISGVTVLMRDAWFCPMAEKKKGLQPWWFRSVVDILISNYHRSPRRESCERDS